jgi:DNA invertase Pin-like site-specific DNA recombinase
MKVLYVRVSTIDQKTDRQRVNESDFDLVIEDKVSGAVAFFEREGGKKIKNLIEKGVKFSLHTYSIDRAGRDLRDIINTVHYFNQHGISCEFISQGIRTLDDEGKENAISKLMISILGTVSEMNRVQIRVAKMKGIYKGRKAGSTEDTLKFLSKPKNKKVLELLKMGVKAVDAAKAAEVHINTVTKIKKLAFSQHF